METQLLWDLLLFPHMNSFLQRPTYFTYKINTSTALYLPGSIETKAVSQLDGSSSSVPAESRSSGAEPSQAAWIRTEHSHVRPLFTFFTFPLWSPWQWDAGCLWIPICLCHWISSPTNKTRVTQQDKHPRKETLTVSRSLFFYCITFMCLETLKCLPLFQWSIK